eukprot:TRINITY_DN8172_c0_g1_i1.p1 TRINITY_DN8172_c0_g1~~TRINITY_DN8172_c0_g1_i1.p1  ORF type:complete len:626 (-),score=116.90 TRINITY_DN8172_c0_g1_i1:252-2129(-)
MSGAIERGRNKRSRGRGRVSRGKAWDAGGRGVWNKNSRSPKKCNLRNNNRIKLNPYASEFVSQKKTSVSSPYLSKPEGSPAPRRREKEKPIRADFLLNFRYAPIKQDDDPSFQRDHKSENYVPFSKERFLQANYRFLVKTDGNYISHAFDSDRLVHWDDIVEILFSTTGAYTCPICLAPPVAAKITRCGHIFCYSCILQYLSLVDKRWRECPICKEMVYEKHLRSAVIQVNPTFDVGKPYKFVLMKRDKTCTITLPRTLWKPTARFPFDYSNLAKYMRFVRASNIENILHREELELKAGLQEETLADGDTDYSAIFYQIALEKNKEAKEVVRKNGTKKLAPQFTLDSDDEEEGVGNKKKNIADESKDYYFFYQSADGQHCYLHPFSMVCLLKQFKSVQNLPDEITVTISEKEEHTQSERYRKKQKCLSHMSLGTSFTLCEIDIAGSNLFSKECKAAIAPDVKRREKRKRQLAKERAAEAEKIRLASLKRSIMNQNEFQDVQQLEEAFSSYLKNDQFYNDAQVTDLLNQKEIFPDLPQLEGDSTKKEIAEDEPSIAAETTKKVEEPSFLDVVNNIAPPPLHTLMGERKESQGQRKRRKRGRKGGGGGGKKGTTLVLFSSGMRRNYH